jgi:hypothetical protein
MKQRPRFVRMLAIAVLVILGSTAGVRPAHADIVGLFTGSWYMQSNSGDLAAGDDQSIDRLFSLPGAVSGFDGFFWYTGSISNYSHLGAGCSWIGAPCTESWSGEFSGGTVTFGSIRPDPLGEYEFTGVITGGSFHGEIFCAPDDCLGSNEATFSFVSTWTRYFSFASGELLNAWSSRGTMNATSACLGTCGGYTYGPLTMTTSTVPEPGSMALLGAGIGAFAVRQRQKRSKQTT